MPTEQDVLDELAQLRPALARLQAPDSLTRTVLARQQRGRAGRLAVAAGGGALAAAAVATVLTLVPGSGSAGARPQASVRASAPATQAKGAEVTLAGYRVRLPAGVGLVRKQDGALAFSLARPGRGPTALLLSSKGWSVRVYSGRAGSRRWSFSEVRQGATVDIVLRFPTQVPHRYVLLRATDLTRSDVARVRAYVRLTARPTGS